MDLRDRKLVILWWKFYNVVEDSQPQIRHFSFGPFTRLGWQGGVNIFKPLIFFIRFKVIKAFELFTHGSLNFFRLLFPHFLQGDKLKLRRGSYIRLSEVVNARMTIDQKRLVNALVIVIRKRHLGCWILRVLPNLHQQIDCQHLLWRKMGWVTVMPVVKCVVFVF